jgi:hypothetical protein
VGADPDRNGAPVSSLRGLLDEVRVSSVARYGEAPFVPAERFEPEASTLLLLHLDGAMGAVAPDASAGQRHAFRVGAVSYR